MNKELLAIFYRSIERIKNDDRCLGAWHFGSISRGLQDEFSDVDPVFLIQDKNFEDFSKDIPMIFKAICDKVILIYPKEFNSNTIKNYGMLLQENNTILQYDLIMINAAKVSEHFCKLHYEGCTEENIIFDKDNRIKTLLNGNNQGVVCKKNVINLIYKYMYYLNMTIKYYIRNDFFRILTTKEVLYDAHSNLLLSIYQKTTWGGIDSLIKYNLPQDKQENLLEYFTSADMKSIKVSLKKSMDSFFKDAREICNMKGLDYPTKAEDTIINNFNRNIKW